MTTHFPTRKRIPDVRQGDTLLIGNTLRLPVLEILQSGPKITSFRLEASDHKPFNCAFATGKQVDVLERI